MFKTRITRLNTKITYEQQKYNLLREESEGFAKLIFLLFQVQLTSDNIKNYIDKILCLIGFFDLDPNRVLDIVLSAFQCDPYNINFLEILKLFNRSAVPQILGFKFLNFEKENYTLEDGLFIMTAQLIKNEIIEISEILPHLTPTLADIEVLYKSQLDSATEYYKHLQSRVSKELSLVSVPGGTSDAPVQNANHFVNFPELLAEVYKNKDPTLARNQIYKLFEGLVRVRSYRHCEILYSLMDNFYDPLLHTGLVKSLCEVCNWMIEPIFKQFSMRKLFEKSNNDKGRKNSLSLSLSNQNSLLRKEVNLNLNLDVNVNFNKQNDIKMTNSNTFSENNNFQSPLPYSPHNFNQIHTPEEILSELPKILKFLTLGLSTDCILFSKILIILKGNTQLFNKNPSQSINTNLTPSSQHENLKILTDLICKVFLPSLSLIDPTPSLTNDLWSIISLFEYSKRYKIYNFWLSNIYFTHPALYIKYGVVLKETAKWTKTLSKENQRPHGRLLGILTNGNPTIVFDNVIRLLTSYDNQINVFMQTLSFCSSLSYDVITYIICKILADPNKEKLNETNGDMNSWFRYFAYFIGHFFKKFHFAEFSGIFYFLTNRLKNFENDILKEIVIEQYVIKEIIEKMTGTLVMEELNETQVHSCAGGTYLYLEAMDLIKEYKNLKKPISALLKFFMKNSLTGEEVNSMDVENETQEGVENINGVDIHSNGNKKIGEKSEKSEKIGEKLEKTEKNLNFEKNSNLHNLHNSHNSLTSTYTQNTLSYTSILLILLGIRRQNIIFHSKYTKSKLLGYLYDQMQNTFVQLIQFLSMHTDKENFTKFLPKWRLEKYILNYNCQPETVFFLVRNKLTPLYEMTNQEYSETMTQFQGVLDSYQSLNRKIFDDGFDSMYIEKSPFLDDIYRSVWKYISPELYFIFSALQLKDIYVPITNYDKEIEKNRKEMEKMIEENHTKKEIEKIKNSIENLERERNNLKKNFEKISNFLQEKKSKLLDDFNISKSNRRDISRYLIQYCLYPRLIFSKVEAVYSAKMLVILINLKIQNVNVFDIMQKIVKFLLPCILCLTEYESQNLGVFLLEFLKVVKYWQEDAVWENVRIKIGIF
jgi:cell division protein FtsB